MERYRQESRAWKIWKETEMGVENHLILFSNLSTPLRKKQALFIISLFTVGWRKLRSSTLGINGMYTEVVSKSAEAQGILLMKTIPTVWLRRQLRFKLPAAIWLKRLHNNFQERFQSLYVISRKRGCSCSPLQIRNVINFVKIAWEENSPVTS